MAQNINVGYGKLIADSLAAHRPFTGKVFFVVPSTHENWDELSDIFHTGPEGYTRVWTSLSDLFDSDYIADGGDDVIFVAPNYTETVAAAADIDTGTDSAGVTIIGLGEGDERPLISFGTAATADIEIGSNGVTFENIRFDLTGVDALAGPIDVNDSGCTFRKCEFIHADADGQAVVAIVTDAAADYLTVDDCVFTGSDSAGTVSAIRIVGSEHVTIKNSYFDGQYRTTAGAIEVTTTAAGYLRIENNIIRNRTLSSTAAINLLQKTSAVVVGNVLGVLSGSTPIHISGKTTFNGNGTVLCGRNYYVAGTTPVAGTLL